MKIPEISRGTIPPDPVAPDALTGIPRQQSNPARWHGDGWGAFRDELRSAGIELREGGVHGSLYVTDAGGLAHGMPGGCLLARSAEQVAAVLRAAQEHPRVAASLNNLASLLQAKGDARVVACVAASAAGYQAAVMESRRVGYMFREYVGPDEGMLFVFDSPDRHSFWMKNCKVSLDIIWLDDAHRVVEIAHDLSPCPAEGPCPNVRPMRPASYVLEVAGGTARRERLVLGDPVSLHLGRPAGR